MLLLIPLFGLQVATQTLNQDTKKSIYEIISTNNDFSSLDGYIKNLKMEGMFNSSSNITFIAPTNSAFEKVVSYYPIDIYQDSRMTKELLNYHIVPDTYDSDKLINGQLLKTKYNVFDRYQMVKVYKNNDDDVSIGNSKVIGKQINASNGVIYVVDSLLNLPTTLDNVMHDEKQLKNFYELSKQSGLLDYLSHSQIYTVFVSEDNLEGLDDLHKDFLTNPKSGSALRHFLRHQIVEGLYYNQDFPNGDTKYETATKESLTISKDDKGNVKVNGADIIKSDVLASNGVVHILSTSIPSKDISKELDLRDSLIAINATRFVSLLENYGLGSFLKPDEDVTHTFLVPPNEALDTDNLSHKEIESWLKYHILSSAYKPKDLVDGTFLKTMSNSRLGGSNRQRILVRVNNDGSNSYDFHTQFSKLSVQFGNVGNAGDFIKSENNIIYPLQNALQLPRSVLQTLPTHLKFSSYIASLYSSSMSKEIDQTKGLTVFAPNNDAFGRLGLLTNYLMQPYAQEQLAKVISFHAAIELFYSPEIEERQYSVPTLSKEKIVINKTQDGIFLIGAGAASGEDTSVIGKAVQLDILIDNGVVHEIDHIQIPSGLSVTNRQLLEASNMQSMINVIEKSELPQEVLDGTKGFYTIIAPSELAFSKIELSKLLNDPEKLLRFAKLHVIPSYIPRMIMLNGKRDDSIVPSFSVEDNENAIHKELTFAGVDFDTLLSEDNKLVLRKTPLGYSVSVKGSLQESGDVIEVGRVTSGGGVIKINRCLMPYEDSSTGDLSGFTIAMIVIGSLIALGIIGFLAYYIWRRYAESREGGVSLGT
ncbi:FAS1 domain-containing protein [Spinellus fusiger]|nr:FAS1 domain-containing protein [Spinellus fusiger]